MSKTTIPARMLEGADLDQLARDNIALEALRLSIAENESLGWLAEGGLDPFTDTTGLDSYLGATHDGSGNFFHNRTSANEVSANGKWTDPTGKITSYSGSSVGTYGVGAAWWSDEIEGDFDISYSALAPVPQTRYFAVFDPSTPEVLNGSRADAGAPNTSHFWWHYYNHVYFRLYSHEGYDGDPGTGESSTFALKWERRDGVMKVYKNGVLQRTSAGTYSGPVKFSIGEDGGGTWWTNNITITRYFGDDMLLTSTPFDTGTPPETLRAYLLEEDVDAVTLNTDLMVYGSRDGGTTWTEGTLEEQITLSSGIRALAASIDVSGQPTGQSALYKITTANAKELKVHGAALTWS